MNISTKFCRFCALSKSSKELLDLASSLAHFEDVKNRLKLLGINFVNLYEEGLPKSICASCYHNLKNCCHVFERIKDSQIFLRNLFLENEGTIEKEIHTSEIITQGRHFPFDFDCPSLMNVDESTRETVKTLALLHQHPFDARTTQQPQNVGVEQQLLNLGIAQQALKPAAMEQHPHKPGMTLKQQHVGIDQTVKSGMSLKPQKAEITQHLSRSGMAQHPVKQGIPGHVAHGLANRIPTWSTYPNKCDHCGVSCKTILALRAHRRSAHGELHGFQCADCQIMVPKFHAFVEHVREHRPELIEYCPVCNIRTHDPNHINTHPETLLDQTQLMVPKNIESGKSRKIEVRDLTRFFGGCTEIKSRKEYPLNAADQALVTIHQKESTADPLVSSATRVPTKFDTLVSHVSGH